MPRGFIGLPMTRDDLIKLSVDASLATTTPRTQYDFCVIAAEASLSVGSWPKTDAEFISAALGQARGLFGSAFLAADDAQKSTWIDMCERALREVAQR
jgi:hypothetical protein